MLYKVAAFLVAAIAMHTARPIFLGGKQPGGSRRKQFYYYLRRLSLQRTVCAVCTVQAAIMDGVCKDASGSSSKESVARSDSDNIGQFMQLTAGVLVSLRGNCSAVAVSSQQIIIFAWTPDKHAERASAHLSQRGLQ